MTTKNKHKTTERPAAQTAPAARPQITSGVESITPALATELLKGNTRNRSLVQSRVLAMAEDMAAGRWRATHQGVAVATDGTLLDGQHRLNAVLLADMTVPMLVTRGLAPESIDAIDTGETRRPHDVMAIADGVSLSTVQRSAVTVAARLVADGNLSGHGPKITVTYLRAAWAEHGADVRAVLDALVNGAGHGRLTNAAVTGSLAIAHRTRPAQVAEFCGLLRTGANLAENHPALLLRNHVTVQYVSGGATARDELSSRTFGMLDAFVRGETRARVQRSDATRATYLLPWRRVETKG